MKKIYLDYASLTPMDKRVLKHVKKFERDEYMNPGALYTAGANAKKALLEARVSIARSLQAHQDEIIFTSSGTEANNIVLQGVQGKHIIVSAIEHSSIMKIAKNLEKRGVKVSYIPVQKNGVINIDELKKAINPETVLVSVMMVNNEMGAVQPISEIIKVIRHYRKEHASSFPLFHTDACQAPLHLELSMEKMGIDIMTLDSHKVYGPRGVGMLYVRRGVTLSPILFGGGQEKGLRPGTENIPGIQGFSRALEIAVKKREEETERILELRNYFIEGLKKINPNIKIQGDEENVSPHILNISIPGIDNEFFVLQLDTRGISCSTKSACLYDEDESYVLKAIGEDSKTSIRFSFGRFTKKSDISYTLKKIDEILSKNI